MRRAVVLVALVACGRETLFGANRPATPEPAPAPAPATPQCVPTTELAPLQMFSKKLDGTDADITNAVARAVVLTGLAVDTKDEAAHTIVTREFVGQTLQSTCGVNEYRAYSLRIVIAESIVYITMGCRESMGWEAHWYNGVIVPANRGVMATCDASHQYVSKLDAGIPASVTEAARLLLGTH